MIGKEAMVMDAASLKKQVLSQEILGVEFPTLFNCLSSLPRRFQHSYKRKVTDYQLDRVEVKDSVSQQVIVSFNLRLWNTIKYDSELLETFDKLIRSYPFDGARLRRWLGKVSSDRHTLSAVLIQVDFKGKAVKGWFVGAPVSRCDNAWACPVCTPIALWKQRNRIASMVETGHKLGINGYMWSFTLPHKFGDALPVLFDTWRRAFKLFKSKSAFKRFVKSCGFTFENRDYLPCIRVADVTLTARYDGFDRAFLSYRQAYDADPLTNSYRIVDLRSNFAEDNANSFVSWHNHYHSLVFIKPGSFSAYQSLISELKVAWKDSVVKAISERFGRTVNVDEVLRYGLDCATRVALTSRELAVAGSPAFGIDRELTERTPDKRLWSIEQELANPTAKRSDRRSSRSCHKEPFELLDKPTIFNRMVWKLYVAGIKNEQRFMQSKHLDKFFAQQVERYERFHVWQPSIDVFKAPTMIPLRISKEQLQALVLAFVSQDNSFKLNGFSRHCARILHGTFIDFLHKLLSVAFLSFALKRYFSNIRERFYRASSTFP